MLVKATTVLLVLIQSAALQEVDETQFFVVSTTQRPNVSNSSRLTLEVVFDRLFAEENKTQTQLKESTKQLLNKIGELENVTRIQKNEMESYSKLFHDQTKQIEKMQKIIKQLTEKLQPRDCKDIRRNGNTLSGAYRIKPKSAPQDFEVWCDMETKGGGWIYVINRFDGSQNFNVTWTHYKHGFGNLSGEFWMGLEHLYQLTGPEPAELLIELTDWDLKTVYADYKKFGVGNEEEAYKLKIISDYSGDAGRDFYFHEGDLFSTTDRNNKPRFEHCPVTRGGGWWYNDCYYCLLTGKYHNKTESAKVVHGKSAINCHSFHGYSYSLKQVKMMIRPYS